VTPNTHTHTHTHGMAPRPTTTTLTPPSLSHRHILTLAPAFICIAHTWFLFIGSQLQRVMVVVILTCPFICLFFQRTLVQKIRSIKVLALVHLRDLFHLMTFEAFNDQTRYLSNLFWSLNYMRARVACRVFSEISEVWVVAVQIAWWMIQIIFSNPWMWSTTLQHLKETNRLL